MAAHLIEIEGTWEEVAKHGPELSGRRVRLTVLSEEAEEPYPGVPLEARPSTAASLLKYAGTWGEMTWMNAFTTSTPIAPSPVLKNPGACETRPAFACWTPP
jgi:hypothetical protein